MEFEQPAVIAEALAQAAVHDGQYLKPLFFGAEEAAANGKADASKSLVQLLDEMRADERLSNVARWEDGNKLRGVIERSGDIVVEYVSQFCVPTDQIDEKTAEMINTASMLRHRPYCRGQNADM